MARPNGASILVVDDHEEMGRLLAEQLEDAGHRVTCATGGADALARCRAELPDVVVTDLRMAGVDGLDVLAGVREQDPDVPVLVMTAFGAVDTAIEAIKRGAYHYLTKPFDLSELLVWVDRALADLAVRRENALLKRAHAEATAAGAVEIVGRSQAVHAVLELVEKLGPSPAPVLVTGESGTGKELVARALHAASPRRERPFVAVSCTALDEARLDSDLFGQAAAAGAPARRGLFVEADGGTLFLDEIGEMSPGLQAKLLRVLEDGVVRAVGSDTLRRVDVRLVVSTHHRLEQRVAEGRFRQDLFFRLHVLGIPVPPLRERRGDIPELVERFVARARARNPAARARRFSPEALRRLAARPWPGNVRELENLVERMVILSPGEEVSAAEIEPAAPAVGPSPVDQARDRLVTLRELEDEYIAWVVARCGGNKTRAAEVLGIDASTIYRRERERGS